MKYLLLVLLGACEKPDPKCGTVVQIHDDAVLIRMDSVNLIYTPVTKQYALGDKICL